MEKIENHKESIILIACDYIGSYQSTCNEELSKARKKFFKEIIKIAKIKKIKNVSFSFFSTDIINQQQIDEVTNILESTEIKKIMKQLKVEVLLGGQYRKAYSDNVCKYEDIIEELENLSYQYNVTDIIALDDVILPTSKILFIKDDIYIKYPEINIEYVSLTSSFPFFEKYRENGWKINMYGMFTEEEYNNLDGKRIKQLKGLGKFGYMSNGLAKILKNINNR